MIDPKPPNDDKYGLRRTDRPTSPTDDGYKISIIMFMFHDKHEAEIELGVKVPIPAEIDLGKEGKARHSTYIGVTQADIKKSLKSDGTLIGGGESNRMLRMFDELEKFEIIEINEWRWRKKPWHTYYELTENGDKIWEVLQNIKEEKISELLYCLKDLQDVPSRNSGQMVVPKFGLEKKPKNNIQSTGKL